MIKYIYIILAILTLSICSFARDNYREGFYVTKANDTVHCFVYRWENGQHRSIKIKKTLESKVEKVKTENIISFKMGIRLFRLIEMKKLDLISFMRVESIGSVMLYSNGWQEEALSKPLVVGNMSSWYYLTKGTEEIYFSYGPKFKEICSQLMGDCQELMQKVETKEFDKHMIYQAVKFYNQECKK